MIEELRELLRNQRFHERGDLPDKSRLLRFPLSCPRSKVLQHPLELGPIGRLGRFSFFTVEAHNAKSLLLAEDAALALLVLK